VRRALPLGHPDFGKAFPCRCVADEDEEQRLARLQRYSNLRFYLRLTFGNLMPRGRSGAARNQERFGAAFAAAQEFAEKPEGWLVFTGPSGCGKTHMAAAIANRGIEKGALTLFMAVSDLLDHLRAAYRPDSEMSHDALFDQLSSVPLLILDDLGSQPPTPWAREKLFQLVNQRFLAQLPTVFTTSLPVERLDERLQTRLTDAALSRVFTLEEPEGGPLWKIDSLGQPLLKSATFKTFDAALASADREEQEIIRKVYRQALAFAQDPKNWLVLAGDSGKAKTRLAAAIGNYCLQAGRRVMFLVVPDLLDYLRASFDPSSNASYDETFDAIRESELLVLDDLGAHTSTPWAEEKLFQLINYRYNALLPTVITTSSTSSALDGRIVSRITDGQVSTILLLGEFDFWGREPERSLAPLAGRRGRPPKR